MDMDEYQDRTEETAIHPGSDDPGALNDDALQYLALGLAGEAGEVAEKIKKYEREDDIRYISDLQDELGDVLWYLSRLADEAALDLGYIAKRNLHKLEDRQERGQLTGEGDDR